MRTRSLRHWLAGMAVVGLVSVTPGCKSGISAPSTDWLSWGKKKPSMSTLATTTPQKPSSTSLPSPAMTTGVGPQGMGMPMGGSSGPSNSYAGANGGPSGSGYYSGPNGMGQNSGGMAQNSGAYSGAPGNNMGSMGGTANGGYQSPYSTPATGGYRSADTRNAIGGTTAPMAPSSPYGASAAPQSWNSNGAMGSQVAPATYGAALPGSPAAGLGRDANATGNPAWGSPAQSTNPYNTMPAAGTAGLNSRGNTYAPGSTSRNAGSYGVAPSGAGVPSTAAGNSPYPSTGSPYGSAPSQYPSTGYSSPAAGNYPTTAPASPYGGYSYPSTQ